MRQHLETTLSPNFLAFKQWMKINTLEDKYTESIYNTATISDPNTTTNIEEILGRKEEEAWRKSSKSEINNFLKRGSLEKFMRREAHSKGREIIPFRWVFEIKHKVNNTIRYKTRLCVKGFHQVERINYIKSFSPVAISSRIAILLSTKLHLKNHEWIFEMLTLKYFFWTQN